jgi:hypothetical protein
MKRFAVVLMALLIVAGTAGMAAAALTFNVDFWTDGTNNVNYAKDGAGATDLGKAFVLRPTERINVDIYFSTDLQLVAASWDMQYSPFALVSVFGTAPAGSPWLSALDTFEFSDGSVKYQSGVFPPTVVTGEDLFFGRVIFECLGEGDVKLVLANYLGFLDLDPSNNVNFENVNLGTLNQVPIPGAVWLLGAGLAGLVGIRRKMRK